VSYHYDPTGATDLKWVWTAAPTPVSREPQHMIVNDINGNPIVTIDLSDGTVTIDQPGKVPEAARTFWEAVGGRVRAADR
jgi:hypothetical protein